MVTVVPLRQKEATPSFEDFWKLYPKKVEKQTALQEWVKLSDSDKRKAFDALPAHCREWANNDPHYILYACRWLKRRRFEDELEVAQIEPCHWKGCTKPGTQPNGRAVYCERHVMAIRRGETC